MKLKILRDSLFIVFFIYTFISAITVYFAGIDNISMTTDFAHYNRYWNEFTNFPLSDLSKELYNLDLIENASSGGHFKSWIPNPFYSIISIFPITLFGSPALLKIIGFILGLSYIKFIKDLANKVQLNLGPWELNLLLIGICINRWFIKGSLGLSTMFLCSFFLILGLRISNKFLKSLFFSFSILIRPNFIIFFLPFFFATLINDISRKKTISNLTISCFIPLIVFPFWQHYIDSSYPGTPVSMLFYSLGQGIDWTHNYIINFFKDPICLNQNSAIEFISENCNLNFNDLFSILKKNSGLDFVLFKVYILKIFVGLGMRFENALRLPTLGGWYLAELWSLLYFIIITLPGFIFTVFLVIFKKLSYLEFSSSIVSLIYFLGTSLFIGDPRYSLLVMPIFVFYLIKGIKIMRTSDL